jgi:hypothetical protein
MQQEALTLVNTGETSNLGIHNKKPKIHCIVNGIRPSRWHNYSLVIIFAKKSLKLENLNVRKLFDVSEIVRVRVG